MQVGILDQQSTAGRHIWLLGTRTAASQESVGLLRALRNAGDESGAVSRRLDCEDSPAPRPAQPDSRAAL
jgi:hypothetical protein